MFKYLLRLFFVVTLCTLCVYALQNCHDWRSFIAAIFFGFTCAEAWMPKSLH